MQTSLFAAIDTSTAEASTPPVRTILNHRASVAAWNHATLDASTTSAQDLACTRRSRKNVSKLGYNSGSLVPTSTLRTPKRRSVALKTTSLPNLTPRRRSADSKNYWFGAFS